MFQKRPRFAEQPSTQPNKPWCHSEQRMGGTGCNGLHGNVIRQIDSDIYQMNCLRERNVAKNPC